MSSTADICSFNYTKSTSCAPCFYGPYCQFSTVYYGFTTLQMFLCSIESIPLSGILLVLFLGTLWNTLGIGTFCQSRTREMGTGVYRLWISIVGQLGLMVVVLHLLLEKHHKPALGCFLLEYLRKALHGLYDSLTACTAVERTVVILQGISFNKASSRRVAKLLVPVLILYHFLNILDEPFHRRLIFSSSQSWCRLDFPNDVLRQYHSAINILHFLVPYLINLCLPVVWLVTLVKQKSTLNQTASIWTNLKKVLGSYKYTLISCFTLVLLNTPRFLTMFTFTCIESQWQNTAYLLAYLISLVPMVITVFIFVLPSPTSRPVLFSIVQRIFKYRHGL